MDLWAAGCVMYELSTLRPLFPGSNELDQLYRIHGILGTPPERVLSKFYQYRNRQIPWDFPERTGTGIERGLGAVMSKHGISLLYKLLKYDPEDRITARLALRSEWCQAYKLHRKSKKGFSLSNYI
jgi:renal tumor antigen